MAPNDTPVPSFYCSPDDGVSGAVVGEGVAASV